MAIDNDQFEPAVDPDAAPHCYDRLVEELSGEAQQRRRIASRYTWLRAITFTAAAALLIAAAADRSSRPLGLTLGLLSLAALLAVCIAQERASARLTHIERLMSLARIAGARWRRQWDDVPVPAVTWPTPAKGPASGPALEAEAVRQRQTLAADLDLFGRGSLFHLICRSFTHSGRRRLGDWLFQSPDPATIACRQQAVAELRDDRPWRQQLELESLAVAFGQATPEGLIAWADLDRAEDEPPPLARIRALAWSLPAVLWISLLLAALNGGGVFLQVAIAAAVACFVTALWYASRAFETLKRVTTSRGEVIQYSRLFDHIASRPAESPWLADIRDQLARREGGPAGELRRLGRVTWLSSLREAGAIQAILYMTFQLTLLADLHLLCSLERWRHRNAGRVGQWFELLGEVEAAASLAGLAFDHPQWVFPEVDPQRATFEAGAIGHPLLAEGQRVANDVEVGPPGTLLLVTGSNMSGKSTLLRSIGLNALLAQAGGPVCAQRLTMPPVRLGTSVRVQDSLSDGVSFFMAELKRLKQIVDMARGGAGPGGETPRLLYLLDEILQGTNSAERQIAVSHVLQHLVAAGAIGAVSTHDLELASLPELRETCRPVHFRETLDSSQSARSMTFDYQLRQGVATTTNALKLLELVGLVDGESGSEE